jgi:hypothetical protein
MITVSFLKDRASSALRWRFLQQIAHNVASQRTFKQPPRLDDHGGIDELMQVLQILRCLLACLWSEAPAGAAAAVACHAASGSSSALQL